MKRAGYRASSGQSFRSVVGALRALLPRALLAAATLFAAVGGVWAQFTIQPLDERGADEIDDVVLVETPWYKFRFSLWETGSADSIVYKPLGHELRSENYYSNHMTSFRDWVRLADPDPIEGHTRNINDLEIREQSRQTATYRVVRQDGRALVLEFETRCSTGGGQPWMEKILNRRPLFLRQDTPAIGVENEIVNTDTAKHSVLFDAFNGINLGRVQTGVAMPGLEGKVTGVDIAEERSSSYIFAQEVADAWIGGVNERGLGAAFSFDWRRGRHAGVPVQDRRRDIPRRDAPPQRPRRRLDYVSLHVPAIHGIRSLRRLARRFGRWSAGGPAGELPGECGCGGIEAGRNAAGEGVPGQRHSAASYRASSAFAAKTNASSWTKHARWL